MDFIFNYFYFNIIYIQFIISIYIFHITNILLLYNNKINEHLTLTTIKFINRALYIINITLEIIIKTKNINIDIKTKKTSHSITKQNIKNVS
jgi:hypothetical protein